MFERATQGTMRAWELAQEEARRLRHNYVGTEHLLVGLIGEGNGLAARVLMRQGADLDRARRELDRLVEAGVLPRPKLTDAELLGTVGIDLDEVRRRSEDAFGEVAVDRAAWRVTRRRWRRGATWTPLCGLPVSPRVKRVMELAGQEADALTSGPVAPEHVLLALIRDALEPFRNTVNRRSRRVLAARGVSPESAVDAGVVLQALGIAPEQLRDAVLAEARRAS